MATFQQSSSIMDILNCRFKTPTIYSQRTVCYNWFASASPFAVSSFIRWLYQQWYYCNYFHSVFIINKYPSIHVNKIWLCNYIVIFKNEFKIIKDFLLKYKVYINNNCSHYFIVSHFLIKIQRVCVRLFKQS